MHESFLLMWGAVTMRPSGDTLEGVPVPMMANLHICAHMHNTSRGTRGCGPTSQPWPDCYGRHQNLRMM
jgi:hypothetical protein